VMITPLQLKSVFPLIHDPNAWCRIFTMELPTYEIDQPLRLAAWLAQCGYESQEFNVLRESGTYGRVLKKPQGGGTSYDIYSATRLMEIWPKKFPTIESTVGYLQNPEGLLNYVYANELGNGPPESRDGTLYRGGGLIQLTGRANYREVGRALNLKLESMPKMIEQPNIAARTSAYFWKLHDLNDLADHGFFDAITAKINGGMNGAEPREAFYTKVLAVLNLPPMRRGLMPGAPVQSVKGPSSPGPQPGPVPVGTQDGLHAPGRLGG
jgi:putative chitinase